MQFESSFTGRVQCATCVTGHVFLLSQEVTAIETTDDVREDKTAKITGKEEEMPASLTKQDSSSQSILAALVQPLSSVSRAERVKDQELNQKQQNVEVPSDLPKTLAFSSHLLQEEEERGGEGIGDIHERADPHPSTEEVAVVPPPEIPILVEDSGGSVPPREEGTSEDLAKEQLSTPEKDAQARRPIKSRLPAAIFSETSSESGAGGFHFSLPKEPLRPLISTTPPPMRPVHHDTCTPDSEERGASRRSIIPDVVLPVVTETPGMSSQGMYILASFIILTPFPFN